MSRLTSSSLLLLALIASFCCLTTTATATSSLSSKWTISSGPYSLVEKCQSDDGATFFAVDDKLTHISRVLTTTGEVVASAKIAFSNPPIGYSKATYLIQQPGVAASSAASSYVVVQRDTYVVAFSFSPSDYRQQFVPVLSFNWTTVSFLISPVVVTDPGLNTLVVNYLTPAFNFELRSYDLAASTPSSPVMTFAPIFLASDPDANYYHNAGFFSTYRSSAQNGNPERRYVAMWMSSKNPMVRGIDVATGMTLYENVNLTDYSLVWTSSINSRESGMLFYGGSAGLMSFDAIEGKQSFTYPNLGALSITSPQPEAKPQLVMMSETDSFTFVDVSTGKIIRTIPISSDLSSFAPQLLFNGNEALLFSGTANNTLISLIDGGKKLATLRWFCYEKHMPVERVCNRPDISAGGSPSSTNINNRVIFTQISPAEGPVIPVVLDAATGEVLATFNSASDKNDWSDAKNVIAVQESSNGFVAVYSDQTIPKIWGLEFTK